ncbi:guanylate-binding protein 1-like [Protopterus annectens]|uniref:guanylate-binding protein 1-like n=1 Tax=Protopterus annectens TaxID=7888 RepID=UPI001CFC089A|nr:guanylate-binding protein 1-like [Protopterus annectens]
MEKSVAFPTESVKELSEMHAQIEKEAIEVFMKRSFKDEEGEFQALLTKNITSCYEQLCQKNEQESANHCKAIIMDLFSNLEKEVADGLYSQPGGYKQFIKVQRDLLEKYMAIPGKGVKADAVLQEFLKSKEDVAASILQADQSLSEKEKEIEAERAKAEAAAMEVKVMEESQKAMEQMIEDQQRTYEENMRQLEKKMEEDREKLLEEQKKALDQKLKEQQDLLQKGFQEKADRLSNEITELRREREQARQQRGGLFDILGSVLTSFLPRALTKVFRL